MTIHQLDGDPEDLLHSELVVNMTLAHKDSHVHAFTRYTYLVYLL
jgi:hypothetical protein